MRAPKFIRDWLTEDDAGEIWSLMHAAGAAIILTFIGCTIWHVAKTGTFDMLAFGTGAGTTLGGVGAGVFANSKSGTKKETDGK